MSAVAVGSALGFGDYRRHSLRDIKRTYVVLALVVLLYAIAASWQAWTHERAAATVFLTNTADLEAKGLEDYFERLETDLKALSEDLPRIGDKLDLDRAYDLVRRFEDLHSELFNVSLTGANGTVLLTAKNAPGTSTATLANEPSFQRFLEDVRRGQQFGIGQPLISVISKVAIVPMRYAITDKAGQLTYVLSANLSHEYLQSFWKDAPITEMASVGLIGDNGYLLSRYPVPPGLALEQIYGQPRTGALINHLRQLAFPAHGAVQGPSSLDEPHYLTGFRRLSHYPVTLFITMPMSEVWRAWLSRVSSTFGLLLLVLAGGWVAAYRALRRQNKWGQAQKSLEEKLVTSELLTRATLDAETSEICVLNRQGTILTVNRAWREFCDENRPRARAPNDYVGVNYLKVCSQASGPRSDEAVQMGAGIERVCSGALEEFALEYPCHSSNAKRWFRARVTRFKGNSGNVVVSHENITERKLVQEHLQASHDMLNNLSQFVPGVIYQYRLFSDGRSCFPYASAGIQEIYEVTPAQVQDDASAVFARLHADDYRAVAASIQESARSLKPWRHEYRVQLPERGERWVFGQAKPQKLDDGSVLWYGFITDITERKRMDVSMHENERILRAAIEALDEAFVLYDPQDRLVLCNEKYRSLYAVSADLIVPGATFEHIIRTGAERGQYIDAIGRIDAWVNERMAAHRLSGINLIQRLESGRTLRIVEQRTTDGFIVGFRVDITALIQATEAAENSARELQNLLDAASEVAIIATDRDGVIQVFNRGAERLLGYDAQELVGKHSLAIIHLDQEVERRTQELSDELHQPVSDFQLFTAKARDQGQEQQEWTYVGKDGTHRLVSQVVTTVRGADGDITGYLAIAQDITERKATEVQLNLAASVFTHAREGIIITDARANIIRVNEAFTRITGYSGEEVIGRNPSVLGSGRQSAEFYAALWRDLATMGYWNGEIWNRRKNGKVYAEMIAISSVCSVAGEVLNYVALFTDITPIKEYAQQLENIAHYDVLTGLPNRALLADRVQQGMAQCQRRGQSLAVVFVDLDGFKAVNDAHGHDVGDELLIVLAHRMKAALREGDTLARIGGDEFIAVLADLDHDSDCQPIVERILMAAAEPVAVGETRLQVSASIGVTLFPKDGVDADRLLRHADQAMYQAKQAGRNRYQLFDSAQHSAAQLQREGLTDIRRALDRREFVLHYQPRVNMKTGTLVGAEALIRWQHPERGTLLLGSFLPIVENQAIEVEIGEWVIDTALTQVAQWQALGLDISVSVNISAHHLQNENFFAHLQRLLDAHPAVRPGSLELEILETSALKNLKDVSVVMHACRALGVHFALDDFGTGYSSLTYLKSLPADWLKIDQSFVRDMLVDPNDLAIVKGVIGLAGAFQRQVIAEGVETADHGRLLLSLGCDFAQGFGIARPMPGSELPQWAANWHGMPCAAE